MRRLRPLVFPSLLVLLLVVWVWFMAVAQLDVPGPVYPEPAASSYCDQPTYGTDC